MDFLEKLLKKDSLKLSKIPACIFGHSHALKADGSHLLKCGVSICHSILQYMSCMLAQMA